MTKALDNGALYGEQVLIHKGEETLVHRARRLADGVCVIRKSLRAKHPTMQQRARQRHEFSLLSELESPGIVAAVSLDHGVNGPILTLEDNGGGTLAERITRGPIELPEFFDIAISLVEALGDVHRAKIVHKDINPDNILWLEGQKRALIFDFGIANRVAREYSVAEALDSLEGTLAYLAPEQSGRTNRPIDWRSDFYGLGATLYEAIYGRPVFVADDPMTLVHAHLARQPEPLDSARDDVPAILWHLIETLLAKSADDRYQSTHGIAIDLNRISAAIADGSELPATLEGVSVSDRFELPTRLYGRDDELKSLRDAYGRVLDGRTGIVWIQGRTGTGKSALAGELALIVAQGNGYFVSGKFERYGHAVPYAPLMQAARSLLRQILAGTEAQLKSWRERIGRAVGANAALIAANVPELGLLIGERDDPEQLSMDEGRNRFRLVLLRFFQALATTENPVVLFIDDLQWADLGSLDLLRGLLTHGDTHGLLVVAAFREEEVTASHPLRAMLEALAETGVRSDSITPTAFTLADAVALISDATHCSPDECRELAALLVERSGGRPFYLRESLLAAYESQAIRFDPDTSAFTWDMAAIRGLSAQVDLGSLLTERIERLPGSTRRLLGIASCVGLRFDLTTVADLEQRAVMEVAAALQPAFDAGLIWSLGAWRLPDETEDSKASIEAQVMCRFAHDEVQSTAYQLVDSNQRLDRHLAIASILEKRFSAEEQLNSIFEIVNQVSLAIDHIVDPGDRLRYAGMLLLAAGKASESAAFQDASRLVRQGRSLLPHEPWHNEYRLWIELARIGAEAAALSGDKAMLDELVAEVKAHARTTLDETEVIAAQISYFVAHLKPAQALSVARTALKPLGVVLPRRAKLLNVASSLARTLWMMRGKEVADLGNLPSMQDPKKLAAMSLLLRTISPAYIADPNMFPLIVLHMVRLSIVHGNSRESPFGYVTYGILLSAGLGQLDKGSELGRFALELASRDASDKLNAKLAVSFYVTLHHWKHHLAETLPPLLAGHHAGLQAGDIEYACHCAWWYCSYVTWSGETLDEVDAIQRDLIEAIDEHDSEFHSVCGRIFRQFVRTLSADTEELPRTLEGDVFDESSDIDTLIDSGNFTAMFVFHQCRATLNYLLGDFSDAVSHGLEARRYERSVLGSVNVVQNTFYLALASMRSYAGLRRWHRFPAWLRIRRCRRRLRRWAKHGPETYAHKSDLVEGEWHSLLGDDARAMAHFDRARAGARAGRFLQDEALAMELMARCQLRMGMQLAGEETLGSARAAWLSWGCCAKARQLEAEFPNLLRRAEAQAADVIASTFKRKSAGGTDNLSDQLDVTTALKASRAMMEEIVIESLLDTLMRTLIENAGAQTGALVLNVDGEAHLRAVGDIDRHHYEVIESTPVHSPAARTKGVRVPLRIVDYVWRSAEIVVLDDAASDQRFAEDPDVNGRKPLSALAAPLEHRGRLVGMIYLENSRTPAAFTEARVSMIQVLAAQAAISIQNARLYQDLKNQANDLSQLNLSLRRFVPSQFLSSLGHDSVTSVRLGENMHREMSVLFSDIRGFTTLVESLEPNAHVAFINEYLSFMEPAIVESGGFVDSYIGDAIMALFDEADAAVGAGLKMAENLALLNETRRTAGKPDIRVGIGISTGALTLGTIGGPKRIKCGVIGDTVNLAARIESLTRTYGASLLISHHTKERLSSAMHVTLRQMERVMVKGQSQPVTLFEVLDALPEDEKQAKTRALGDWNAGMEAFYAEDFNKAGEFFGRAASSFSGDLAARRFVSNCWRYLDDGVPDGWTGIVKLDHK